MMDSLGWLATVLIGVSLGLLGGGGSILTVPVLVYLFGVKPYAATAYSLFVVGWTALVGSGTYIRRREIDLSVAVMFAIPSMTVIFLTRRLLLPLVPSQITSHLSKDQAVLMLFAALMLIASVSLIRRPPLDEVTSSGGRSLFKISLLGAVVGFLAGLVGAGGGFLIIPALVLFASIDMRTAIGTSLLVIGVQSLVGFAGDLGAGAAIDWSFLLTVTGLACAGVFIGSALGRKVPSTTLRPAFGWFVGAMAVFIVLRELAF